MSASPRAYPSAVLPWPMPWRLGFALIVWLFSGLTSAATLQLSDEEQAFVREHPVIRIGVDAGYAPYAFFDNQQAFQGLAADVMQLISQSTGLRFEPVPNLSWPEILSAAQERKLDVITTAALRPERTAYLNFTQIYIPTPLVIITRDERPKIRSSADFEQGTVALVKGYSSTDEVLERHPKINAQLFDTPLDGLNALAAGEVEAYVGVIGVSHHLINLHGLSNLKINAGFDMALNGQRLATRKDWPVLNGLLDRALSHIDPQQRQAIFQKWVPIKYEHLEQIPAGISAAQQTWLEQHPTVRVGVLNQQEPYESFTPPDYHRGLASAYLEKLRDSSDQLIELHGADSPDELLEALRAGKIDLISAWYDPKTPSDLLASRSYLDTPLLLITTRDDSGTYSASNLGQQPVIVRADSMADRWLKSGEITTNVIRMQNNRAALDSLLNGQQGVAVLPAAIAVPLLQQRRYSELRVAGALPKRLRLRMLMRSDWQTQQELLNQLFSRIADEEHSRIRNQWFIPPMQYGLGAETIMLWAGVGGGLAITLFAIAMLWNRRLHQRIQAQHLAQQALLEGREKTLELMINEVRQREQVQDALRDQTEMLRRAQQVAAVGSGVYYPHTQQFELSDEACRILQCPADKPLSLEQLHSRLSPDDRRRFQLDWQACLNGHALNTEYPVLLEDGEHWVGLCAELDHSSRKPRIILTLNDLDEIRRQQQEYRRLHQLMTALIEGSIDCIFVKDEQGHYLIANRALCELTGLNPEQLIGRTDYELFPADLAEQYRQDDQRFMQLSEARTFEEPVQTPSGRRVFLTTKGPLLLDGEVRGVFGISREISELKKAEEHVRLLNTTLENRVAQRTAELEHANQELRSFSYSVSHDLKAPLRAIQGYSQLLLEDHTDHLNSEGLLFVQTIDNSARQMSELIDNLLDYSRTERQELQFNDIDLPALVDDVLTTYQPRIEQTQAEIVLHLHDAHLHSDARCLKQILSNLIDNALKFQQPEIPPKITISARHDPGHFTLRVQDNGIGFDMKFNTRIFDIFQRLHSQTEFAGTGIGLAIVRKAAQRLGAQVWAESRPGLGSSFFVRIPQHEPDDAALRAD